MSAITPTPEIPKEDYALSKDSHTKSVIVQLHMAESDDERFKILREYAESRSEYGSWYKWASEIAGTNKGSGSSPDTLRNTISDLINRKEIMEDLINHESPNDEEIASAIENGFGVWASNALRRRALVPTNE